MSTDVNSLSLGDAALYYAARGWPVFPCSTRGKIPMIPGGFTKATTDEAQILVWWKKWPEANVAVPTGPDTFDVLDIDGDEGERTLYDLETIHEPLPPGPKQTTGKGHHYFFGGGTLFTSARRLPGIDVRGAGGYIVIAPSVHRSGVHYRIIDVGIPPPQPPEWLIQALGKKAANGDEAAEEELGEVVEVASADHRILLEMAGFPLRVIPEGKRDDFLFKRACALRGFGYAEEAIHRMLELANKLLCRPPLTAAEVRTKAHSAMRYAPKADSVIAARQKVEEKVDATHKVVKEEAEDAKDPTKREDASLDEIREMIAATTGVRIEKVIQVGRDHAQYYFDLGHGEMIHVGSSITRAQTIREVLYKHHQIVGFGPMKPKRWDAVLRGFARIIEMRDDLESERQGETLGWVRAQLEAERRSRTGELARDYIAIATKRPFIEGDFFYLNSATTLASLRLAGVSLRQSDLVARLREVGFERGPNRQGTINVYEHGSRTVSASYWRIPLARLEPAIEDDV